MRWSYGETISITLIHVHLMCLSDHLLIDQLQKYANYISPIYNETFSRAEK